MWSVPKQLHGPQLSWYENKSFNAHTAEWTCGYIIPNRRNIHTSLQGSQNTICARFLVCDIENSIAYTCFTCWEVFQPPYILQPLGNTSHRFSILHKNTTAVIRRLRRHWQLGMEYHTVKIAINWIQLSNLQTWLSFLKENKRLLNSKFHARLYVFHWISTM